MSDLTSSSWAGSLSQLQVDCWWPQLTTLCLPSCSPRPDPLREGVPKEIQSDAAFAMGVTWSDHENAQCGFFSNACRGTLLPHVERRRKPLEAPYEFGPLVRGPARPPSLTKSRHPCNVEPFLNKCNTPCAHCECPFSNFCLQGACSGHPRKCPSTALDWMLPRFFFSGRSK